MELNSSKTSYQSKQVIEPNQLNERRNKVGLPPIEAYISIMNERYFGTLKE